MNLDFMIKEKITIYYDKECPFCNSYVGYLKLKDSYELILKNVREDKNIDSKFDINNGFIVNFKDNFFQGSKALEFLNSVVKPLYSFTKNSSYHLFVVKVDFSKLNISKVELFNKMREKNIGLQLHYIPINKQPYYKSLGYGNEDTPIMNRYYDECFSLPMYSSLSNEEQEYVIKTLFEILK